MAAGRAEAHVGFILPDAFHYTECGPVGAVATFSDAFPAPEVALRSDAFAFIAPSGERLSFASVQSDHAITRLVATLEAPGNYRLTSGVRYGRTGRVAVTEDGFQRLDAAGNLESASSSNPAVLTSRAVTVSETSISCGARTEDSRERTAGRLTIRPLSDHMAGVSQLFEIRYDNGLRPVDEIRFVSAYGSETENLAETLNANAVLDLGLLTPGPYTLLVRHIAHAPADADVALYSYSTALTFEIRAAEPQPD
ncbi:MAG: hypothetical protein ACK46Q_02820 [Hyphomonas sp.]